jgi:hypothetical protein
MPGPDEFPPPPSLAPTPSVGSTGNSFETRSRQRGLGGVNDAVPTGVDRIDSAAPTVVETVAYGARSSRSAEKMPDEPTSPSVSDLRPPRGLTVTRPLPATVTR